MKNIKPVLSVCLLSSLLMGAQVISPGLSQLASFYHVSESAVSLSVTLPYLVSIPFTLISGRLPEFFSLKKLLLVGASIICITGLMPYFISSYSCILFIRAFMGVGLGILFSLTPAMAPAYYPDGTLRNFTIGMQSAWAGSGGFVFNILSGHLANSRIQNIYLVYFLCIAFTLIVCLILPEAPFASSSPEKLSSIPGFSLLIGFITFLFLAAQMTLTLNISALVSSFSLGGTVEAGYATSAYSAAAFLTGWFYTVISKYLKNSAVIFACLLSAIGMLLCILSRQLAPIYIGSALLGVGLSLYMPTFVNFILHTAKSEVVSSCIAIMMTGSSIGQSFSAVLINPIAEIWGPQLSFRFYTALVLLLLVLLLSLTLLKRQK